MLKRILTVFLSLQLAACGGGGGGGGGTSRPATGVRLLHGGIDVSPLEVVSGGDPTKSSGITKFGDASNYLALDTGVQIISLHRANTNEIIGQLSADVKKGELRTIIISGSRAQTNGVVVNANLGVPPQLDSSSAAIRVAHGAYGAATISAVLGSTALAQPIGFAEVSDYQVVPAGGVSVSVTRSVDGAALYSGSFDANAGASYTVFVAGEIGYYIKTSVISD